MNKINHIIRTEDFHQDTFPRLEHVDIGSADDDPGATWIGDLFAAVRRQALKLFLWVVVCFAASLCYVQMANREYVASAQIALEPRARPSPGAAEVGVAPILDSAQAESQLQIVRSVRNLTYVFETLKLTSDPDFAPAPGLVDGLVSHIGNMLSLFMPSKPTSELTSNQAREIAFQKFSDRVQVRRLGQSYVIEVSYRGSRPEATARVTNSIAAAYIRDQILVRASSEQRGTEFLQGRITLIQAEKRVADEAVATGVITDYQFPDSDARIVGAALKPLAAAYPQTKLILLFGIVVGFVTGVAFIAIVNNFDQTLRSSAQVRRSLGIECLVLIPRLRSGCPSDTAALDRPETEFARSMRLLRTVLSATRSKTHPIAIGFVSCQEGDGCSAVSANVAGLLAASNNRVVLIDACLQKPDLSRRLAPNSQAGLDQVTLASSANSKLPEVRLTSSLSFVPAVAAHHVADPNVFLGTPAMQTILSQYKETADLIIDLPSIEMSSDAQALGGILSGVVLVASLNRTKLNQLSKAIHALRLTNCRILGVVLNDSPSHKFRTRLAWLD